MNIFTKTVTFTALAASFLMNGTAMARDCYAWERDYDRCVEKKCNMFVEMAANNSGTEEGHAQAVAAGACLATCKAKEMYCKHKLPKPEKLLPRLLR
jgi:hypothetical protein